MGQISDGFAVIIQKKKISYMEEGKINQQCFLELQ